MKTLFLPPRPLNDAIITEIAHPSQGYQVCSMEGHPVTTRSVNYEPIVLVILTHISSSCSFQYVQYDTYAIIVTQVLTHVTCSDATMVHGETSRFREFPRCWLISDRWSVDEGTHTASEEQCQSREM
jgi:hypothetical protein